MNLLSSRQRPKSHITAFTDFWLITSICLQQRSWVLSDRASSHGMKLNSRVSMRPGAFYDCDYREILVLRNYIWRKSSCEIKFSEMEMYNTDDIGPVVESLYRLPRLSFIWEYPYFTYDSGIKPAGRVKITSRWPVNPHELRLEWNPWCN